jgi:hypothetical protein
MTDSLLVASWMGARDAVSKINTGSALLVLLYIGLVALLVDYAYMIYFYMRMVQFESFGI